MNAFGKLANSILPFKDLIITNPKNTFFYDFNRGKSNFVAFLFFLFFLDS
jgi:hypothetical protein